MSTQTITRIGTVFFTDHIQSVSIDKVKTALDVTGLDPELARDLAKRFCFARAKTRLSVDGLIDEVLENEEKWLFQLSAKYKEDKKLSYEYEAQFGYNKVTQTVFADNETLLQQVNELFAKYGATYLPSDVSRLIRRVFDKQKSLLPLRNHGVIYLVPEQNYEIMEKVSKFVEELGGTCTLIPIQSDNAPVKEKAQTMLVENVKSEMTRITAELAELRKNNESLTKRVANNRWKELLGQLDRLKLFANSLNADTNKLLQQVRTAEFDLALVTGDNLDVIAALAHAGKMNNALGDIARTAYVNEGELPAIDSPRVKKVMAAMLDADELPVIKNGVKAKAVVAALDA